jgi:phytoene dehydrogenase-like protein
MIESEWDPWRELREDRAEYDEEKDRVAREVMEVLNGVWPGIQGQIEMTDVATPHTWWRYTRNRRGAFEGFAVTDKIFTARVRRTLPGLDGFFMAGQWVVPGGGVIPTLMSGKHAAMLLCSRDGRRFRAA